MTDPREEEPCKHYLGTPSECPICSKEGGEQFLSPTVWASLGGKDYHITPQCSRLEFGQQLVEERGGTPAPIESMPEHIAKLDYSPCPVCFPESKRK